MLTFLKWYNQFVSRYRNNFSFLSCDDHCCSWLRAGKQLIEWSSNMLCQSSRQWTLTIFYFLSFFFLIYCFPFLVSLFWRLRVRVKIMALSHTSHMTKVTVICYMEKCKRFWKNNIRQHVDLKANIWLFRVG